MYERSPGFGEFSADVEGFSGPFDLLCFLVESGALETARISVGQIVRIYGAYLANTHHVSVETVSEFLYMAATLVLAKARALLPRRDEGPAADEGNLPDDGDVLEKISRYRPYRIAAGRLRTRKERQDRVFFRPSDEEEEEQFGNLGDLYALCRQWWDILESRRGSLSRSNRPDLLTSDEWDGIPSALPEEEQIERKISEILAHLAGHGSLRFSQLLNGRENVTLFVVTLLALLEMARMGRIRMEQEDLFHDIIFYAL
ncbi:MAG: segregation/condensation protein A [Synergistaceae bacterium]|nr:segregation/condensation protein A [Synergistaceae bacterium]